MHSGNSLQQSKEDGHHAGLLHYPELGHTGITVTKISIDQGKLFNGEQVIIPTRMRAEMLRIIYNSHLGIEKCKCRARDVLHWPGMSSEI